MSLEEEPLERLVREARAERPREIDWTRAEARLERAIRDGEAPRASEVSPATRAPWAALALAAGVALAVGAAWTLGSERPSDPHAGATARDSLPASTPPSADRRTITDPATGQAISARAAEVEVVHSGRARWRLEPGGEARIADGGDHLTVALERGALFADVVPSARPEAFAVEIGGARVAVKGTSFRVVRAEDHVEVEVREGTVVVGPAHTRGATVGSELTAPARGRFGLDGMQVGHAAKALSPERGTSRSRGASSAGASSEPQARQRGDRVAGAASAVVDAAQRCFVESTPLAEGTRITARGKVAITFDAAGTVASLRFDPPLSPAVRRCTDADVRGVTAGELGTELTVERQLAFGE